MEKMLTTRQVSEVTGYKPQTLRAWRARGEGPPWQKWTSGSVRYVESDVARWMAAQRRE